MSTAPQQRAPERMARRAGIASLIGTTIEWYDFYIYGTAAALVFSKLFFPNLSNALGIVAAFATFWVGFLARPLGAVFFGHLGDRAGRKIALVVTLVLTGGATTLIGALPTAEAIGALAPILLIVLRMIQGFALGGEWGGAVLIAAEHAPAQKKVLYASIAQVGAPIGLCLAMASFFLLSFMSDANFLAWGWRLPFLASGVLLVVGLVIRLRLEETPEMKNVVQNRATSRLPLKEVLTTSPMVVILAIGACTIGGSSMYFKTTFALSWATTSLDYSRSTFLALGALVAAVSIVAMPYGAVLATKFGIKRIAVCALASEAVLLPVMFALINTESTALAAIGLALATIPNSMYYAVIAGMLANAFPARVRYTGISVSYQLCGAVLVGTTPMVAQYFLDVSGSIIPVVVFALAQLLLSLVCAIALLRRTGGHQTDSATTDTDSVAMATGGQ
ncbi:MFS transporter [Rhodococcus jostii]|uniref:MFS transporter n=1 Tax=Rhodococcus jostii TaxID=132919 RepID=A0ABU4CN28_RHOJO|nr:MFS transporter [Rhodococcus jostii]MDV6284976.1 MFS transporter [Rhodococcus jostii]